MFNLNPEAYRVERILLIIGCYTKRAIVNTKDLQIENIFNYLHNLQANRFATSFCPQTLTTRQICGPAHCAMRASRAVTSQLVNFLM